MTKKRVLVPDRVRHPPREGFSWVDRRFVHEHASHLTTEAILLYLFLASVSDRLGLSYWGTAATAARLHIAEEDVEKARRELVEMDLVAVDVPLVQVLSLPECQAPELPRGGNPMTFGEILGEIAARQPIRGNS